MRLVLDNPASKAKVEGRSYSDWTDTHSSSPHVLASNVVHFRRHCSPKIGRVRLDHSGRMIGSIHCIDRKRSCTYDGGNNQEGPWRSRTLKGYPLCRIEVRLNIELEADNRRQSSTKNAVRLHRQQLCSMMLE